MRLITITKKVIQQVVTDVVNFVVQKKPGVRTSTVLDTTGTTKVDAGALVSQSPVSAVALEQPAAVVTTSASGSGAKPAQTAGGRLSTKNSGTGAKPNPKPAGKITRIRTDLTHLSGANASANDGPDNWTNPGNATGSNNGTNATRAGQALAATNANLRLGYADFPDKAPLTISDAALHFYVQQAGTTLNNGGLHLEYRLTPGGAWTSLAVYTGDVNFMSSPDVWGLGVPTWAQLNDLEVRVRAVLGAGTALVTCSVDAVLVRIVASRTDNL